MTFSDHVRGIATLKDLQDLGIKLGMYEISQSGLTGQIDVPLRVLHDRAVGEDFAKRRSNLLNITEGLRARQLGKIANGITSIEQNSELKHTRIISLKVCKHRRNKVINLMKSILLRGRKWRYRDTSTILLLVAGVLKSTEFELIQHEDRMGWELYRMGSEVNRLQQEISIVKGEQIRKADAEEANRIAQIEKERKEKEEAERADRHAWEITRLEKERRELKEVIRHLEQQLRGRRSGPKAAEEALKAAQLRHENAWFEKQRFQKVRDQENRDEQRSETFDHEDLESDLNGKDSHGQSRSNIEVLSEMDGGGSLKEEDSIKDTAKTRKIQRKRVQRSTALNRDRQQDLVQLPQPDLQRTGNQAQEAQRPYRTRSEAKSNYIPSDPIIEDTHYQRPAQPIISRMPPDNASTDEVAEFYLKWWTIVVHEKEQRGGDSPTRSSAASMQAEVETIDED